MSIDINEQVTKIIGNETIVSEWFEITQLQIDKFAEAGGEYSWIHNEPERCIKESPFEGKTIVQGNLLLSIHTTLAESLAKNNKNLEFGMNYGYDRVRFIQPVTVGSKVRSRLKLKEMIPRSEKNCLIKCDVTTEIKGIDKPALIAEWSFYAQFK